MVEDGRVLVKGRIRASTEKLSRPVRKNGRMSVSTGTLFNSGECQEKVESVRLPEISPDEYRKMVESV